MVADVIVDCHGHLTTAPAAHARWREQQLAGEQVAYPAISDDALRTAVVPNQLRLADERGIDLTLFSPRASTMGHHLGDPAMSAAWTRHGNDLIARLVELFPQRFAGVCALPQSPAAPPAASVGELRRCVEQLGFVGVNLNPDPSAGYWTGPPLTDPSWFPLYEVLVELEVPAMVHVSASANPAFHATGAHYLNADTTAFMQLVEGDLFGRFPTLRLVLPHGGGAVPYHWGRYRGLAAMLAKPPLADHVLRNVFFDSCVYHQPGIDLLLTVLGAQQVLFGSETVGAVRGDDPETGFAFDDTRRYVDRAPISESDRALVYEGNARRVYPRLAARLRDGRG